MQSTRTFFLTRQIICHQDGPDQAMGRLYGFKRPVNARTPLEFWRPWRGCTSICRRVRKLLLELWLLLLGKIAPQCAITLAGFSSMDTSGKAI